MGGFFIYTLCKYLDKDFSNSDLVISTLSKNFLKYAAKWASFLAIVGFVTLGLLALVGLIKILIGSQVSRVLGDTTAMTKGY